MTPKPKTPKQMPLEHLVCVGQIAGAHGVRGHARLRSFTDDPESIFEYAPLTDATGEKSFELTPVGVAKDCYVVTISNVDTREEIESLRGTKLYVPRDTLPATDEGTYYAADLIGLTVLNHQTRDEIGKVKDLHDYGAGAFLEVVQACGPSFMLPFRDANVPEIDLKNRNLTAILPEGWLNPVKQEKEKPGPKSGKNKKPKTNEGDA